MLAAAIALCTWGPSGRKESTDERGDARGAWHLERSINGSQTIDGRACGSCMGSWYLAVRGCMLTHLCGLLIGALWGVGLCGLSVVQVAHRRYGNGK